MSHPYDRWLQSDAAFERFHGLDYDESAERRRELAEERQCDAERDRELREKESRGCSEHSRPGRGTP